MSQPTTNRRHLDRPPGDGPVDTVTLAELRATVEQLYRHVEHGDSAAEETLGRLTAMVRARIAERQAAEETPGVGGHRWYPGNDALLRCTGCPTRASNSVVKRGLVPACPATECTQPWHEIYLDSLDPDTGSYPASLCIFCEQRWTTPQPAVTSSAQ